MSKERIYDGINVKMPDDIHNVSYQHIHIDSSNRLSETDTPSMYSVQLREKFSYVTSVKMIDANIPFNSYTITKNNNMIYYQETHDQLYSDTYTTCEIPIGRYDILKLCNVIKHEMTKASICNNKYTCVLNEHTSKITIHSSLKDDVFSLIWTDSDEIVGEGGINYVKVYNEITKKNEDVKVKVGNKKSVYIKNSIGKVLGFLPINLKGEKEYTGTMIYNTNPHDYISLHISTDSGYVFKQVISTNDYINDAFVVITTPMSSHYSATSATSKKIYDLGSIIKHFNPPIGFTRLNIKFLTKDGELYDFNGQDHYIILEVQKVFGNQKLTNIKQLY